MSTPAFRPPLPARAVVLAGGAVLLVSIVGFFRVPLLPALGHDLSMSAAELGVLTTAFGVGRLLTDIPAGRVADRARPEAAFAAAGLLAGLGSFVLAATTLSALAYLAAFVLGIGSAVANTTGMTFFSRSVPPARRGTALAIFSASLLGGQALGPAVSGLLAAATGWRASEAIAGAIGLATAGLLVLAPPLETAAPGEPLHEQAGTTPRPPFPLVERAVLYGISFVTFFMLAALPQTLVPLIGAEDLGLGSGAIGLALGLGGLCRLFGAFLGGAVSDRISRKAALVPGMAASAVGVALLVPRGTAALWLAGIVLMSLGSFGVSVAATMIADRTHLAGVGRRFGSFRFIGDVGVIAGPIVTGFLYAHASRAAAVLVVAGAMAAVTVASAAVLTETRREHGSLAVQD